MPNNIIPLDTKLEFEKRVLEPSKYPVLQNEDGSVSTHSMAWGDSNGKFYAYPTVVLRPDNTLVRLPDAVAWHYAQETKQYREFDNMHDAAYYAEGGYKLQWGALEKKLK